MVYILPISMLLIGLAVGAGACWLVLNTKLKHVADNARSEANAEISGLKADVSNRDAAIEQLKTEISEARTALKDLQDDFTTWPAPRKLYQVL